MLVLFSRGDNRYVAKAWRNRGCGVQRQFRYCDCLIWFAVWGASAFGPNQCANDPDGTVDHDERVKVTGMTTSAYDARLILADGRVGMAKGAMIETGNPFSIEDKDLVG
jgi:hypothetical protein